MSAELIRAMSGQLASDPSSLVFLPLGEALLERGELANALRVVRRGAERHPARADARELLARIYLASGDEAQAELAWGAALELEAELPSAHRGLGLLFLQQQRLDDAAAHLAYLRDIGAGDEAVEEAWAALQSAREAAAATPTAEPTSAPPIADDLEDEDDAVSADALFVEALDGTAQAALLLDAEGLVVAGSYVTAEGEDLGAMIGAQLSGVSDEADRAMRHFGLGSWTRLSIESEAATAMMAPTVDGVTLVAAARDIPLGFVRRSLDRCVRAARDWLGAAS